MQKKKKKSGKLSTLVKNFGVDILFFLVFIIDMNLPLTGVDIHEWLGFGIVIVLIIHLLQHWKWIAVILKRLFKKRTGKEELKFIVDIAFFIDFVVANFSGIMISKAILPFFGYFVPRSFFWHWLHIETSLWGIYLLGFHLALNWRWIVKTSKRYFIKPLTRKAQLRS